MKRIFAHSRKVLMIAGVAAIGCTLAPLARSSDEVRVEVPLQAALAPSHGYDDNDAIEVVLHGSLPNSCYHVDTATFEETSPRVYRLHQFAHMSNDGVCANKEELPPYLKMAVPFTTTLRIGRLEKGEYTLQYEKRDGVTMLRSLGVEAAASPSIDNLPYAPVTAVTSRDYIGGHEDVIVTITGVLNSDCVELDPNVQVIRQGDVFVVLPTIRPIPHEPGPFCETVYLPFTTTLNFGKLPPGHYLVHVRSMAGNAISKVYEVTR